MADTPPLHPFDEPGRTRVEQTIDFDGRHWRWSVTTVEGHWLNVSYRDYGHSRSEKRARREMARATRYAVEKAQALKRRDATKTVRWVEVPDSAEAPR